MHKARGAAKAALKYLGLRKGKPKASEQPGAFDPSPPIPHIARLPSSRFAGVSPIQRLPSRRFLEPTDVVPPYETLKGTTTGLDSMINMLGYNAGAAYHSLRNGAPSNNALEAFLKYRESGSIDNRKEVARLLGKVPSGNVDMSGMFLRFESGDKARKIARVMADNKTSTDDDVDFLCAGELSARAIMPMVRHIADGEPNEHGFFAVLFGRGKINIMGFLLSEAIGKELHIQFLCASKEQELMAANNAVLQAQTFPRIGSKLVKMAKEFWCEKTSGRGFITLDSVPNAVGFYEKMGFVKTGEPDFEGNLPMRWECA